METRIDKFNESKRMSRVAKNIDLYKEINDTELDNFNVRSNATVIGNQDKEIDVEQIKKILDKRYNSAPRRRSIRIEPQEEVSKISVDDTKEYDLTKVLEKAKDEKVETYEENRAKKLRNTQYDILNNLNLDSSDEEVKEEKKIDPEENLMNLINTITINEAKKQESKNDVDPLDILTDLKGEDDTQVYDSVTTVTKITEIKEKEKEKQKSTDRRNKRTAGNGKYGRTSGFPDAGRKLLYRRCIYDSGSGADQCRETCRSGSSHKKRCICAADSDLSYPFAGSICRFGRRKYFWYDCGHGKLSDRAAGKQVWI